jgi:anaerobic selenocysteine-containing dehydrogenase
MRKTRDSIENVWGNRQPFEGKGRWPVRVDGQVEDVPDQWVQSACVLCTNGCGMDIGVKDGRIVGVRGRAEDIVNRGRLGPKGLNAWVANNAPDRLTRALIREGGKPDGKFREATWDEAMDLIVSRCKETQEKYTGGAIGIYNSGQLFIEDYYTLSVLVHAGLGTPHMDGNTRLCTATAAMALRETFGNDGQPGTVADYDVADCILHVGHNIAATQTVSWMRILDRRRGPNPPKMVVIDTRATPTAREADDPRLRRILARIGRGHRADASELSDRITSFGRRPTERTGGRHGHWGTGGHGTGDQFGGGEAGGAGGFPSAGPSYSGGENDLNTGE